MNPLLQAALGAILRWGLAFLAGYLVKIGIWTGTEADTYVTAGALAVLALAWSLWQKYRARLKFLAALDAPAGTDESDLKVPKGQGAGLFIVALAVSLAVGAVFWGCAGKTPPNVGTAGKIAYAAKNVTDAAGTALKGIELFTDQGLLPKPVAIQTISMIRHVGLAGNALADALRVYAQSRGASGGIEIRTTVQNIQRLVTDSLVLIPDLDARKRVQQITQPILDALAAILIPFDNAFDPAPWPDFTLADWNALTADADAALARLAY